LEIFVYLTIVFYERIVTHRRHVDENYDEVEQTMFLGRKSFRN